VHCPALRLVDDGLVRPTAALGTGERPQDLARLRHNRARFTSRRATRRENRPIRTP